MKRKRHPQTHMLNGLGEQQIRHAGDYALRMHEEITKVSDPREKLKIAENWLIPLTTYIEQARANLDYEEPDPNPYMKERGDV